MTQLDPEEKELLQAFNAGPLESVKGKDELLARHREAARATMRKDERAATAEQAAPFAPFRHLPR